MKLDIGLVPSRITYQVIIPYVLLTTKVSIGSAKKHGDNPRQSSVIHLNFLPNTKYLLEWDTYHGKTIYTSYRLLLEWIHLIFIFYNSSKLLFWRQTEFFPVNLFSWMRTKITYQNNFKMDRHWVCINCFDRATSHGKQPVVLGDPHPFISWWSGASRFYHQSYGWSCEHEKYVNFVLPKMNIVDWKYPSRRKGANVN